MIPSFFSRLQLPSGPPTVCVIAGDDAAPEVMRPTVEILRMLAPDIRFVEALSGREAQERYGEAFPNDTREKIDAADCTIFGASGGPSRPVLWYLRWGKETYVNVRPVQWYSGYRSPMLHPEYIDYVIVRDNLEGMYPPREGDVSELVALTSSKSWWQAPPIEKQGAYAVRVCTDVSISGFSMRVCAMPAVDRLSWNCNFGGQILDIASHRWALTYDCKGNCASISQFELPGVSYR